MKKLILCSFILQLCLLVGSQSQPEYFLDTPLVHGVMRIFLKFFADAVGTGKEDGITFAIAVKEGKVQEEVPSNVPFPCDVRGGRSPEVPDSVNRLRPGDIDVVASMGDSVCAGFAALSTNLLQLLIENRGVSAAGGGQANWRKFLTLPNIFKEYNPNLIGYALGDSLVTQRSISQFHVAQSGAVSEDMPFMATYLINRMKSDRRVDIKKNWKFISLMIGGNDICSLICANPEPWSALKSHKEDLIKTLRTLRDNLPRTLVHLYLFPNLEELVNTREGRELMCYFPTTLSCSCLFVLKFRHMRTTYYDIMRSWFELDKEIAGYPEFNTNDFAVSVSPSLTKSKVSLASDGYADMSYLAPDCFHISQKANGQVANNLWNNLLEPFDNKTETWTPIFERFLCPTKEHPYLMTRENSYKNFA